MALHCPATILLARHGDATTAHPDLVSDEGGWLTPLGQEQVRSLAKSLRGERVSEVCASPLRRAVESAELAATALQVLHRAVPGLEEVRVGDLAGDRWDPAVWRGVVDARRAGDLTAGIPGGETGAEIVSRFRNALDEVADTHRGETVLVFSHGTVMGLAVRELAEGGVAARERPVLPNAVPARLEVGDDGIRLLSWPGDPLPG
jgi:probable phosphoglycerate mutase